MTMYVGLDVSLKTTSICIVEADGSLVWEGNAESELAALVNERGRPKGRATEPTSWRDRIYFEKPEKAKKANKKNQASENSRKHGPRTV